MITHIDTDEYWMQQALARAVHAESQGEVPVGAVLVLGNQIIGEGWNQSISLHDPTAHAEILALGAASGALKNWRLEGCVLYATLEPCPMCAGGILNARIAKVVYGSKDKRLGALGSTYDILNNNPLNRDIEVKGGVLAEECLGIIQEFFQELRRTSKVKDPPEIN